jgi:photosystem II stability/assembly factor-like uncharacterized protein
VPVDSLFHGLVPRNIGPSGTSGRIAAIDAVVGNPDVIWVGAATGGIWKSVDGGLTWATVFDEQAASSIGAIAINQSNPDLVWVGTGEANVRNSMGVGRGVYKTRDGGKSWEYLGLAQTERIHRIVLDPRDPEVAYLSALGPAWSDGTERGVFKTNDGGLSWQKVLYVDERTGASGLVMDPSNPDHLLASTWEYRRWPWFFKSGGPGSGLWVTYDGGGEWKRLGEKEGLPAGELGRIGLAFATNDPDVVYALVEAGKSALLRSSDGGDSWRTVNAQPNVNDRPFYYGDVAVDPTNENRLYRVSGSLGMSEDGGRTFREIAPWAAVHPDHHALWIDPADGRTLYNGNDGGVFLSHDRGGSWHFVRNIPVAQFYHISVDMAEPFNVLGGLQDNGTWMGPSQVWEAPSFAGSTLMARHWRTIGFGDGFAALIDPADPDFGYSMSQGGALVRFDLRTGIWKSLTPTRPADSVKLRFNWNAGIATDSFETGTIYYGSQFVHRTRDQGRTWEIISPDLTTNDPEKQKQAESGGLTLDVTAAENHTTILTIAPSPVERGVIWVGTDDGNVQLTRDGGTTWTNVVERIARVPAATWVPHIEPSRHAAGTAYVVFDNHRRGDWGTYVYKTTDFGRSWTSLATAQLDGFVHVIEEDPEEPNLLFLGTEFGLFFSLDGGRAWSRWGKSFPVTPVLALVVHPRDHDLVVATHGRAAWILDDVRPLREMAARPALAEAPLHLFQVPPAVQAYRGTTGPYYFPGNNEFFGGNRPYGALISYRVKETSAAAEAAGEETAMKVPPEGAGADPARAAKPASGAADPAAAQVAIQILDASGEVIRELKGPARAGVNRVTWDLKRKGFEMKVPEGTPEEFLPSGPDVLPGTYTVRLSLAGQEATGTVEVRGDPRRAVPMADRREKLDALMKVGSLTESLTRAEKRLEKLQKAVALIREQLGDWEGDAARKDSLTARAKALADRVAELSKTISLPEGTVGIVEDSSLSAQVGEVYGSLSSSWDRPTQAETTGVARVEGKVAPFLEELEGFFRADVAGLQRALAEAGFSLLGVGQG